MTFEDDYRRAKDTLRAMNELASKVTTKARQRMAAHSIREQLEHHLADLRKEFGHDQSDVDVAFAADALPNKGWDTSIEP